MISATAYASPYKPGFFALLALALCSIVGLLAFSGCESTDARSAGRTTAAIAVLGFDSPADAEIFEAAKLRIDNYLATGQPITGAVVDLFADWLAAELGRNPGAVRLVVHELQRWIIDGPENLPPGQLDPAREFVTGVSETLGIAFPRAS